jgi:hypothetical protein
LGGLLKQAAASAAYNVNHDAYRALVDEIHEVSPELAARAEKELLKEVRVSPTLVKYADPNAYEIETRRELRQIASELLRNAPINPTRMVDLIDDDTLEIELACTLLYEHCNYSYRQIRTAVEAVDETKRCEIIDAGLRHRGRHDEMLRAFRAGQQFRFDILMDIGGFRDMHRHRRCIQVEQGFTTKHGYDVPEQLEPAGALPEYTAAMKTASDAVATIEKRPAPSAAESAQYAIPLGFRKRTLFKMDFAEAVYISELRTGPAGHFSYRNAAYAMFEEVQKKYPALAKHFRVHDVHQPVDLLQR